MTAPRAIVNPASRGASNAANIPPLTDTKSSYDITQIIRMTREEWRVQRLHDMANIFLEAFEVQQ
jgi:hypothetical protein